MKKIFLLAFGTLFSIQFALAQVEYSATGGGNFFTLAYPANVTSLTPGLSFTFKANHTITGSATLNVNGLGNVTIKKEVTQDLVASDILSGQIVTVVYDGANFQMTSNSGNSGAGGAGWELGGNSGTTPATDFIGTTDAQSLVVRTNNAERITVLPTGQVGIGINNPAEVLEVYSTSTSTPVFKGIGDAFNFSGLLLSSDEATDKSWGIYHRKTSNINNFLIQSYDGVSHMDRITVKMSNGFVGMGNVQDPQSNLHIVEISGGLGGITVNNAETGMSANDGFFMGVDAAENAILSNKENTALIISSNFVEGIRVLPTGNVGIGISPTEKFEVNGKTKTSTLQVTNGSGSAGQVLTSDAAGNATWQATGGGSKIEDLTGDTYIETDALGTGLGNEIDFNLGGTQYFKMVGPRLNVLNSNNGVYIGENAGFSVTSGGFNTAVGNASLEDLTTGTQNTAYGANSLKSVSIQNFNTAIGAQSLQNAESLGNTAVGYRTLLSSDGDYNVAMGYGAMQSNTDGDDNVGIGRSALFFNLIGINNSAVGNYALENTDGSNNVGLGFHAGDINTVGDDNTFIGANTNASINNLTNATAIGARAEVGQNNSIVLGSIAGVNGSSSNTSVGIGTTTPTADLDVVGSATTIRNYSFSSAALIDGGNFHFIRTRGTATVPASVVASDNIGTVSARGHDGTSIITAARIDFEVDGVPGTNDMPGSISFKTTLDGASNSTERMVIKNNGFIGIGTSNPVDRLEIEGTTSTMLLDHTAAANFSAVLFSENNSIDGYIGQQGSANNWEMEMKNNSIDPGAGISFVTTVGGPTPITRMRVANDGKVGIGTISPAATLDITGTDAIVLPQGTTGQRPGTPEAGMLRYNADLTTFEGYDGTAWNDLMSAGGGTGWELTGNGGTSGTDFIGTTDAQDFRIRTNNIEKVKITQKGQVEILNSGESVMIGEGAGAAMNIATTRFNTFLGFHAGASITTNFRSTAIGYNALELNTESDNTAVGASALAANTTAQGNTALGSRALMTTTTGGNNTAIGLMSMTITTGFQNTAVGGSTLQANTTGSNNNAFGLNALGGNVDGSSNAAFGRIALQLNTSGDRNSAFGGQSLGNTTGSENVALGYDAGTTNATGDNNTFIGAFSDAGSSGLTNSTAIGHQALVAQSNSLVLGSINGVNGASSNTNVGIGTTTPTSALHIKDGHLRHEGAQPSATGNGVIAGSTDVRGAINVNFNPTSSVTVTFTQAFNIVPTIVLTPVSNADPSGTARYWLSNVSVSGFTANWSNFNSTPSINYMIIE